MNLLIVDDEPHIVDWIYELLGEEIPQLTRYKAYGGVQAVHILERTKIDILMTDIRMPKMTGLRLMEMVRERWADCRILFLTGFGEFDYVYAAIQQKGVRYLLKTEDDAVIVRTVKEIQREILQEDGQTGAQYMAGRVNRLLRRERAMNALIRHAQPEAELLDTLGFAADRPLMLFHVRIRDAAVSISELDAETLAERTLTCLNQPMQVGLRDGSIVWLGQRETQADAEQALRCAKDFQEGMTACVGGKVEVSALLKTVPLAGIGDALEEIVRGCVHRPFAEGAFVSADFDVRAENGQTSHLEFQRRMTAAKSMEFLLERGEREMYMRAFAEAVRGIDEGALPEDPCCTQVFLAIALQLMTYIQRNALSDRLPEKIRLSALRSPDRFPSWKAAFDYCREVAESVFSIGDLSAERESANMTDKLTGYIESHLQDALSLGELARLMHYNPSYLSRAFKRQMGVNLNQFILQARMRRACTLLMDDGAKVSEVARQVGFRDARHFADVFRKHTGLLPQAYKNSMK